MSCHRLSKGRGGIEILHIDKLTIRNLVIAAILALSANVSGQIVHVFVGSNDGSPLHVPHQGVVDIPLWIDLNGAYGGSIPLRTSNFAVSERLGGNFYNTWYHGFSDPFYHDDYSDQILWFLATNPPDTLIHLADFTVRMNLDPIYIGDTLVAMSVPGAEFCDSTGYWLPSEVHVSSLAIDNVTGVRGDLMQPIRMMLNRAYPNPFNTQTIIEYSLADVSFITIDIFDILGRKVEMLVNRQQPAGYHQVIWDASDHSSGMYFYRIQAGDNAKTKKMVLLK